MLRLDSRGRDGIALLVQLCADLARQPRCERLDQDERVAMEGIAFIAVESRPDGVPGGRTLIQVDASPPSFEWSGAQDDWSARAALLAPLLDQDGFQYLDYETPGRIGVVVERRSA
jgi:hypothetical protein